MPDARLDAACLSYLLGRTLPAEAPDVAAMRDFVATQAAIEYGQPHGTQASALPGPGFKTGRMLRRQW